MTINTPSDLYQAEVANGEISPDPSQEDALKHFDQIQTALLAPDKRSWMDRLKNRRDTVRGLYLWGGVGTGKTLLMDMFYESLPKGMAKRVHFHRFMQSIHEQKHGLRDQQYPLKELAGNLATKHRVLCLDEFAVTDITDAMILYGLLEALFERHVVLITTSNIQQHNLYRKGLQRDRFLPAIELLKIHTDEVEVDSGNDYRMAFLQNEKIYLTPVNAQTDASLATSFGHLAGHFEDSKSSLDLNGRQVTCRATGSGVVWFDFDALCEGHRSKVDYIEISRRFHTVLLSGIPHLDDTSNDPTRRFIELVDELYDRGVNLMVSADSLPDTLYSGNRLSMEFQRTISRLQEMSSSEYLARPHLP